MAARKAAKRRRSGKRQPARRAARRPTKRVKRVRPKARTRRATQTRKTSAPKRTTRRAAKVRVRRAARPPRRAPRPPIEAARNRRPIVPALLDRERRRLPESERAEAPIPEDRLIAAARTGHDELQQSLLDHTETSPRLTAGDVDAKWQDAYSVGDEAPGGDNPTPDQDRVDDIGRALGVEYQDHEELKGDEKLRERDRHRWELDPASSEDWPHKDDKK